MREMVLNHASLPPAGWLRTVDWLPDVADGMAALVRDGVSEAALRMCRSPHEIRYPDDQSLFEAYQELRRRGARDQYVFLMRMSTKVPLDSDLGPEVADRFRMCEAKVLPPDDGAPLVLCAVTAAIAVSVPSEPVWDHARIRVGFDELLPDGAVGEAEEEIDHLARSAHAPPICERHRERLRVRCSNAADLWSRREQAFPHLTFGPDVEGHLVELNPGWLSTVVSRLADLDATGAEWAVAGGDAPPWRTRVTPESQGTMDNQKLRDARRFRSVSGTRVLFEWHARFGSGGRIHLRFNRSTRDIEVGYIGRHLPLS